MDVVISCSEKSIYFETRVLVVTDTENYSPQFLFCSDSSHTLRIYETSTSNFTIPKEDTFYKCSFHKFPDLESKHHIIEVV